MSYARTAPALLRPHAWLGIQLALALSPRLGEQQPSHHLFADAMAQGGYCLDAPEEFPAGSCLTEEVEDETGVMIPVPFPSILNRP